MKRFTQISGLRILWAVLAFLITTGLTAQVITSFDLFLLDLKTGETEQLTYLPDIMVFNASFSNNGKYVVAEGISPFGAGLGIVDVETSEVWGLEGGEGGNDASWSPNGEWIVFDGLNMGVPHLFLISPEGGVPMMIREYGFDAEWAQDSERIVFRNGMDNSIWVLNILTGAEHMVAPYGFGPSWSPNGNFIAYSDNENLWVLPVDEFALPSGPAVQITNDGLNVYNQQPTWSNNNKTIVFHSNRGDDPLAFDFNLWSVPATGGTPTMIGGFEGAGDFDPCFSKNGKWVVFTSSSEYGPPPMASSQPLPVAEAVSMDENFPNPFDAETTIRIHLPEKAVMKLQVFDLQGALVRILTEGETGSGTHRFVWDGTNEHGMHVANGIYICHFSSGDRVFTQRMTLIR